MVVNMPKKLALDVDNELWKEVQKFRIDKSLKNNNEAVIELIKRGLSKNKPMR